MRFSSSPGCLQKSFTFWLMKSFRTQWLSAPYLSFSLLLSILYVFQITSYHSFELGWICALWDETVKAIQTTLVCSTPCELIFVNQTMHHKILCCFMVRLRWQNAVLLVIFGFSNGNQNRRCLFAFFIFPFRSILPVPWVWDIPILPNGISVFLRFSILRGLKYAFSRLKNGKFHDGSYLSIFCLIFCLWFFRIRI